VYFRLETAVGVTGDTYAVEGTNDNITVKFVRYVRGDPATAPALVVNYTISWAADDPTGRVGSASTSDLVDTTDFENFLLGTATIPAGLAGESGVSFTLVAAYRDGGEGPPVDGTERFWVTVNAVSGPSVTPYITVGNIPCAVPGMDALHSCARLPFYVLDGVTPFVLGNNDSTDAISSEDVRQGGLNDCSFCAAMLAIADKNPDFIRRHITASGADGQGNPQYTVQLWDSSLNSGTGLPIGWRSFTVSANLTRGADAVQLTGDVDDQGRAEIWPYLLECAWAQLKGGWAAVDSGDLVSVAWQALTGCSSDWYPTRHSDNAASLARITNALSSGKQVFVTTWSGYPTGTPQGLITAHVYAVSDVLTTNGLPFLAISDPRGGPNFFVLAGNIAAYFNQIYVCEVP
jgi:hypothetical protein